MTFGQQFRRYRKQCNYTQRDLASLLGVHFTYLSKIENDATEHLPSDEFIRKAEAALFLNSGTLFEISGRIDTDALRQQSRENPLLAKVLRRIVSGADNVQLQRIIDILEK